MARTKFRSFTGLMIDPLQMTEGDVRLADAARSQAIANRYNGHTNFPYSVAQHEVLLSYAAPEHALGEGLIRNPYEYNLAAKAAFLHDWSEIYFQDIITPIKHRLSIDGYSFLAVEEACQKMIFQKYNVPWDFMELIIPYDKRIYEDEAPVLKPMHEPSGMKPLGILIEPWTWQHAEQMFYQRAAQLEIYDAKPQ